MYKYIEIIRRFRFMKKIACAITCVAALAVVLSSCGAKKEVATTNKVEAAAPAQQETVTLRLAEVHKEGYPTTLADREFARLVEERTEGRVKVDVFAEGSLYKDEISAIEAMQAGDLAFSRVSASPVAQYVPQINAIQLPYLYTGEEHLWNVLNGPIGQDMLQNIETSGSGLVGLCYYASGSRSFYLTKEAHTVADLAGLKIRVQNNPLFVRMCELLGAQGVTGIATGDVASAIESGAVDGAENNWPTYESMGDYKAAKYYVLDKHTMVPEILLGSAIVLNKLDEKDAAAIKALAKETQEFEIQRWNEKEKESEQIIREAGNTIIDITPEAYKEFQDTMAPLYDEFGADYKDIIEGIRAAAM